MHPEYAKQIIKSVRQRHKDMCENCDHTVISQPTPGSMEDCIIELADVLQKIADSRIDTVGDANKPQSLVETFWLDYAAKIVNH